MEQQIMFTAEEIAERYNVALSTLKKNPARTFEAIKKKYGIGLRKEGRGADVKYYIENCDYVDMNRAVSLYQSLEDNLIPARAAAGLIDINFLVFIGIVSSPQRVFRGSYIDLLKYLELEPKAEEIPLLRDILTTLEKKDFIMYKEDSTDPMYFMAAIKRKTEKEMHLEIEAILKFQKFVENSRKSWIPLMKIYLALHVLDQPCTTQELMECTGLTEYKVRDSLSILEKNNVILKQREVVRDIITKEYYCIGSTIDIKTWGW